MRQIKLSQGSERNIRYYIKDYDNYLLTFMELLESIYFMLYSINVTIGYMYVVYTFDF